MGAFYPRLRPFKVDPFGELWQVAFDLGSIPIGELVDVLRTFLIPFELFGGLMVERQHAAGRPVWESLRIILTLEPIDRQPCSGSDPSIQFMLVRWLHFAVRDSEMVLATMRPAIH